MSACYIKILSPFCLKTLDTFRVVVIAYVYTAFNKIEVSSKNSEQRHEGYIISSWQKFVKRYGRIINAKVHDEDVKLLVYSVMIYENFNRPPIHRFLERIAFRFGKSKTLGVMQVTTPSIITDIESVKIGTDKILIDYEQGLNEAKDAHKNDSSVDADQLKELAIDAATMKYNPDYEYASQVERIRWALSRHIDARKKAKSQNTTR